MSNFLVIEWSLYIKVILLVLCSIALLLLILLLVYEIFFRKNFVYKVSYYTTDDPDFVMERKVEVEAIVPADDEVKITKIVLVKERKFASYASVEEAAKMDSYNIKKIEYRSSQAKLVGEYGEQETDKKFTSIFVTKKKQ
jgi:hypothetical protein